MSKQYTDEKHALILLALLKAHGIRKIVASPGATNIPIVASIQHDPYFEVYSAVDERSAAYLACGLAEESDEIVALSCTGATASRNYMPGLTEAYYRKLPILAITSFNGNKYLGNLMPQNLDRTTIPNDVAKLSVQLPVVKDEDDARLCNLLCNKAILEVKRHGGGPVHINLTTTYLGTFNTKTLPNERVIRRYTRDDQLPDFSNKKIAIFVGAHKRFTANEIIAIDEFCAGNQAVVLCDHTSSYKGKYRVLSASIMQNIKAHNEAWSILKPDVVFHIGEVSGDYPSSTIFQKATEVWRVSEDGEIRDRGGNLNYVYEGSEISFFKQITSKNQTNVYLPEWKKYEQILLNSIPELPFTNPWIASQLSNKLPKNCNLNLAILNSLRSWNFFEVDASIYTSSNVGGFGIDGCVSTMIGASFANPEKLYFGVMGDLAFFYDINVLANRHVGNNLRIVLINNGCGVEFNVSSHIGSQFGSHANDYIAAGGHFASGENKTSKVLSPELRVDQSLTKAWAEKLGFKYMHATNKDEFNAHLDQIVSNDINQSIIFECFTNEIAESDALNTLYSLVPKSTSESVKESVKELLPSSALSIAKKIKNKLTK